LVSGDWSSREGREAKQTPDIQNLESSIQYLPGCDFTKSTHNSNRIVT